MEFERLYAPSLKDLFVQQLQGMILSGDLPLGTKLPPERELCQQMHVSRAELRSWPVRDSWRCGLVRGRM